VLFFFFTFIQSIDIHSLYFHTQRKLKRKDFFSFLNVIVVLSFQTILDEIFGSSKFNIQCHGKKLETLNIKGFELTFLGIFVEGFFTVLTKIVLFLGLLRRLLVFLEGGAGGQDTVKEL